MEVKFVVKKKYNLDAILKKTLGCSEVLPLLW